jgi:hypothetical protein
MNGKEIYRIEQILRQSIANDIKRFESNFKNKKDIQEAIKIVEKKN